MTESLYSGNQPGLYAERPKRIRRGPQVDPCTLTPREVQAIVLAPALSNKEVARRMGIGPRTAETHVLNAMDKLGITRRVEAIQKLEGLQHEPAKAALWVWAVPLDAVASVASAAPVAPTQGPARERVGIVDPALDAVQQAADRRVREWARKELAVQFESGQIHVRGAGTRAER